MIKIYIFTALSFLIISNSANAQFGGLLNQLKDQLTETIKPGSTPPKTPAQESRSDRPTTTNSENQATNSISLANFRNKWCQNVDTTTVSPVDYRSMKTGDMCLLPDDVITGVLEKLREKKVDINNLKSAIASQLQNIDGGETKFPLMKFVFSPKDNKAYLGLFDALICPSSNLNSLVDGNNFRAALDAKYGKPSATITEYEKLKVQVDGTEKMIAEQKKKIVTVADAKLVREGEQQVGILKNMLNNMNRNTPAQLNWEYDSKNKVEGETGLIVAKLENSDISGDIRCKGETPTAFMIQIGGTSSLQAVFKRIANDIRQDEANKEKNAPVPKL